MNRPTILALSCAAVIASSAVHAQQPPRIGIAPVTLTQDSYVFDTAQQHKLRAVVVAKGLKHPFSLAFLPSGDALVSERGVALRLIHNAVGAGGKPAVLDPNPIGGIPAAESPRNGLLEVTLHPQFAKNQWVYFTFNKPGNPGEKTARDALFPLHEARVALLRGKLVGNSLTQVQELYVAESGGSTSGSRLAFDKDGLLYMTTGAPFSDEAQNLNSAYGKVLRFRDDGSVPTNNPFVGRSDALPQIFTYGHRDSLGLAVHPSGALLNLEYGPNAGDEANLLIAGHNYGWPKISFGRHYDGGRVSESPVAEGVDQPLIVWLPSIAPTGLTFYTGDKFPDWKGNLFIGSGQRGEVPHTGGLERVVLNDKLEELRRETLLTELHQRVRDVRQGPDGLIYVITDEDDGALLRLEPAL